MIHKTPKKNTKNQSRKQNRQNQSAKFSSSFTCGAGEIVRVPPSVSDTRITTLGQWGSTRTTFQSTSAAEGNTALYFTVSDIADFTSLSNVFDCYRIKMIKYVIKPLSWPGVTSGGLHGAELIAAIDFDDASTPSFAGLTHYQNARIAAPGNTLCLEFKPHVATAAYSGAFTSYANQSNLWIDCASDTVQHYGVKVSVGLQYSATYVHAWFGRAYYVLEMKYRH